MSLLSLVGALTQGGERSSGLVDALGGLLSQHEGGLPGLIAAFEHKGLGAIANSWVSTGDNLPISVDQLHAVLGSEQVLAMAERFGISKQDLLGQLSSLLPQVIDHLTPAGNLSGSSGWGGLLQTIDPA